MIKRFIILILLVMGCSGKEQKEVAKFSEIPGMDKDKIAHLQGFAYQCIDQEYPNKPGHVLGDSSSLKTPNQLHPAFYGCFDWHSSVHGHWTLVNIVSRFPDYENSEAIIEKLQKNITEENIKKEVAYFDDPNNSNFERTYGWAWLLKLDEALHAWNDPRAKALQENLAPLTLLIEQKFIGFLDKLSYPIRVGEHPNTAFGLSFALDYARSRERRELEEKIVQKAREYYMDDRGCPLTWEPGGFDFLSPCLQEASLMFKVLPAPEFEEWMAKFLPGFLDNPQQFIKPATISDRSDGKLAHLDGLNFSRAWCLYEIGKAGNNMQVIESANAHFRYSYDKMDSDEYAGAHWLASFALYALIKAQ